MADNIYYRHSGKFEAKMIPVYLLISAIGMAIFSFPLALLREMNKKSATEIGAVIIYGFIAAIISIHVGRFCKIRNRALLVALGAIVGVMGLYFHVATMLFLDLGYDITAYNPLQLIPAIFEYIGTPGGADFKMLLFADLIFVVGFAAFVPLKKYREYIFCERAGKWTTDTKNFFPIETPENFAALKSSLEKRKLDALLSLRKIDVVTYHYMEIIVNYCAGIDDFFVMTIREVIINPEEKGKKARKESVHVNKMYIDKKTFDQLLNIYEGIPISTASSTVRANESPIQVD